MKQSIDLFAWVDELKAQAGGLAPPPGPQPVVDLGRWLRGPRLAHKQLIRVRPSDPDPAVVQWVAEWQGGRYVPIRAVVARDAGIRSDDLHQLGLDGLAHEFAGTWLEPGGGLLSLEISDLERPQRLGERIRPVPDEFLRYASQVYEIAKAFGDRPLLTLAELIGSSQPTAATWVRKAREAGYILSDVDEAKR